jgi:hypothetical protein
MPVKQISNPVATGYGPLPQAGWTTPVPPLNDQILLECVNTSAGTLNHGDVVIPDLSAAANGTTGWIPFPAVAAPPISPQAAGVAVTTTATLGDEAVLGPVSMTGDAQTFSGSIAIGGTCWVCVGGVARVFINAQVVVLRDRLRTAAVAKTAVGVAAGLPPTVAMIGTFFGTALEATAAKDANNTIRALIKTS